MAGEATAIVTFAHRSVFEELRGPAGSRLWRPGYVACLIEKYLPVWAVTPFGYAAGEETERVVIVSHGVSGRPAIADLLPVMAGLFGGSDLFRSLAASEGVLRRNGRAHLALPYAELPDATIEDGRGGYEFDDPIPISFELFDEVTRIVSDQCRATVAAFPDSLVAAEGSVSWLRGLGVDVDEFTLTAAGDQ